MYDNAVLGCGTCYFDCRFRVGRLPGNFKVVAQALGCFSSGFEGQNAFGAALARSWWTFTVGLFLGSFLASILGEAWRHWTKRRPDAIK